MNDEIIEELREKREEHAKRFGYDVEAIYLDAKRRESESEWPRTEKVGPKKEIA